MLVIVSTSMVILIFMYLRVTQKGVSSGKWFVALVAFIWPKTCMTTQMNIQMARLWKKFLAVNALIWSLPFSSLIVEKLTGFIWSISSRENGPNIKMNFLVTFSGRDRSKRFVTNTANNRFIGRIDYWTFKIWLITDKD